VKNAYAGGGDDYDPYAQQVQQVANKMMNHEEFEEGHEVDGLGHDFVHLIGDSIGYAPLAFIIVVGVIVLTRKRLREFFNNWIAKKKAK